MYSVSLLLQFTDNTQLNKYVDRVYNSQSSDIYEYGDRKIKFIINRKS